MPCPPISALSSFYQPVRETLPLFLSPCSTTSALLSTRCSGTHPTTAPHHLHLPHLHNFLHLYQPYCLFLLLLSPLHHCPPLSKKFVRRISLAHLPARARKDVRDALTKCIFHAINSRSPPLQQYHFELLFLFPAAILSAVPPSTSHREHSSHISTVRDRLHLSRQQHFSAL